MKVQLVPIDGGLPLDIDREMTVVGRGELADMKFVHKSVSKQHCVLVHTDGLILIRDLGSTNGTRVNGQRVRRGALLPNDQIAFANFRYTLRYHDTLIDGATGVSAQPEFELDDAESQETPGATGVAAQRNSLPDEY